SQLQPTATPRLWRRTNGPGQILRDRARHGDHFRKFGLIGRQRGHDDWSVVTAIFESFGENRPLDEREVPPNGILDSLGKDELLVIQAANDGFDLQTEFARRRYSSMPICRLVSASLSWVRSHQYWDFLPM